MSVNINVEDMPQSAQTAYARKNKLRGITMKICWALTPVLFVIFCIMSLVNKTFSEDIEFDLEVALTLGCGDAYRLFLQASNSGGIRQDRGTGNGTRTGRQTCISVLKCSAESEAWCLYKKR